MPYMNRKRSFIDSLIHSLYIQHNSYILFIFHLCHGHMSIRHITHVSTSFVIYPYSCSIMTYGLLHVHVMS